MGHCGWGILSWKTRLPDGRVCVFLLPPRHREALPSPDLLAAMSRPTPTNTFPRASAGAPGHSHAPMIRSGWALLRWGAFATTWEALVADVVSLKAKDPVGYRNHSTTKFLKRLAAVVLAEVPSDPGHARYHLGNTLGSEAKFWRRVKFNGRFRLFFRYRSDAKFIVYVWLNDESTLRQAGGASDPYAVFRAMIEHGKPPSTWPELVAACATWPDDPATIPPG